MPRDNHDLRELPYLCSKKVKIIMRRVLLASLITFHFSLFTSSAQTLEECQQAAEKNYPLIQQYDLIGKTTNLTVANIQKGWLPQISASVQATYQSDVTAWPEQMEGMMRQMGIDMVGLKKDQYRVGIDVSQTVYDGGVISSQKEIARKQGEVQKAQTEVNIYKVRKRVNEMYFGLLLINEQIRLNQDLQDVLGTQEKKLSSMLKNGTAAESDYNTVKAERLNVAQQATSLNAQRRSLTRMLSVFCGIRIESGEFLDEPSGIAERRVENDDSLELRTESLEFPTGLQTGSEPSADSRAVANSKLSTLNSTLTVHSPLNKGFRPYIELMAGVYTENQPDFTWLMPYEEKQFVQYFMPYREVGIVKQASKDFIFNIEETGDRSQETGVRSKETGVRSQETGDGSVRFKVLATSKREVRLVLKNKNGEVNYDRLVTLSPEDVLVEIVDVKGTPMGDLHFTILSPSTFHLPPLLSWHAEPDEIRPIPDAAEAALSPQDTKTVDQLYLTGLHLEQYRHATWSALDYYEEALRRDPMDYRCNMQTGLWYLRRANFEKAVTYLETAVKVLKRRNPNPYDGEPLFYLALVNKFLGKPETAYRLFWKSTWNKAWADAGYYEAACISAADGRWEDALDEVERALISNSRNHKARGLKAACLRKLGRKEESLAWIKESLKIDPFNYVCMVEEHLLTGSVAPLERMADMMHDNVYNYHEVALDYQQAGLSDEARLVLQTAIDRHVEESPLTYYYMAFSSKISESPLWWKRAMKASPDYCFPNRLEDAFILKGLTMVPGIDARAHYYLGCLYYDKRQYDLAIRNWERAVEMDPEFPTAWRCLALARFNKQDRHEEAVECMEKAFSLDPSDSRILMELDQLYKRMQRPHAERLAFLEKYPLLIAQRDDLILEEITLLNQLGRYEEAMQKLDAHKFHPWEGGEGKVPAQYQTCRVGLALRAIATNDYDRAITLLEQCLEYPPHLGEGKLYGAQENDFYYLLGVAYDAKAKDRAKARECWEEATKGPQEPAAAMYYNDAKPDKIFYQGMALYKLGREDEAHGRFYKLINYGRQHIFEKQVMDYFAVSLPDLLIWDDSLDTKNLIHCKYMLALGYYGMGQKQKAEKYLKEVEALDCNHLGILQFREFKEFREK